MSLAAVVTGLQAMFATVPGITSVHLGEPKALTDAELPALYTILDNGEPNSKGQVKSRKHRLMHRVCFAWEDGATTEPELIAIYDALPNTLDAARRSLLSLGLIAIIDIQAGWDVVGGALYRVLDFTTETEDKT